MEPRISIVTLGVTDLARMVAFYRDGLGLTLFDEDTESIAFFRNRGTWLALYPRDALAADVGIISPGNGLFRRYPGPQPALQSGSGRTAGRGGFRRRHFGQTGPGHLLGRVTPATFPTPRATSGKSPGTPTSGLNNRL